MSKGENSQMINAKSRLGQNISSVESTTSTNLTKNILIWVSYFAGFSGPHITIASILLMVQSKLLCQRDA